MSKTLEQQIAESEARTARLKTKARSVEAGQKIILGGMLISEARKDARIREWVLKTAARSITREVDQVRLDPLLVELRDMPKAASRP